MEDFKTDEELVKKLEWHIDYHTHKITMYTKAMDLFRKDPDYYREIAAGIARQ